jgi:hypothetical protein|eukprot:5009036-Prymnesium_polylepis.1
MFTGDSATEEAAAFSTDGSPDPTRRKRSWDEEDAEPKPAADLESAQKPLKKGSKPGGFPASKKENEAIDQGDSIHRYQW